MKRFMFVMNLLTIIAMIIMLDAVGTHLMNGDLLLSIGNVVIIVACIWVLLTHTILVADYIGRWIKKFLKKHNIHGISLTLEW